MSNPNFNDAKPIPIPNADTMAFRNTAPQNSLVFMNDEGEIGRLTWSGGVFSFEGDTDECAQQFFDYLKTLFESCT